MWRHTSLRTRLAALIDNLEHDENETVAIPWHWPAKPPATADEALLLRMLFAEQLYRVNANIHIYICIRTKTYLHVSFADTHAPISRHIIFLHGLKLSSLVALGCPF